METLLDGDFKQIDTSWYFLCYAGVPMYKMTGGMEPRLNLTLCYVC